MIDSLFWNDQVIRVPLHSTVQTLYCTCSDNMNTQTTTKSSHIHTWQSCRILCVAVSNEAVVSVCVFHHDFALWPWRLTIAAHLLIRCNVFLGALLACCYRWPNPFQHTLCKFVSFHFKRTPLHNYKQSCSFDIIIFCSWLIVAGIHCCNNIIMVVPVVRRQSCAHAVDSLWRLMNEFWAVLSQISWKFETTYMPLSQISCGVTHLPKFVGIDLLDYLPSAQFILVKGHSPQPLPPTT